ncbi:hypothetical protein [Tunturiibacter gelidoferens]|uniref:Uncharacterized protein n=1 Tax=Tunturiibacter gelidiferens TaxID=3069689 RepID=A0ACC5P3H9_9BACT|nr:hypothetical protein [Edaphobacter lichenicola]MBB5341399.1 hypothetical protein [Edaphobacter lichenicola]
MNALVGFQGKVQEEELDSCRAAGERRPGARDEGAGRNQHGFSLRDFCAARRKGGELPPLRVSFA